MIYATAELIAKEYDDKDGQWCYFTVSEKAWKYGKEMTALEKMVDPEAEMDVRNIYRAFLECKIYGSCEAYNNLKSNKK